MPSKPMRVLVSVAAVAIGLSLGMAAAVVPPDNVVLVLLVGGVLPLFALCLIAAGSLLEGRWPTRFVVRETAFVAPVRRLTILVPVGWLIVTTLFSIRTLLNRGDSPAWMIVVLFVLQVLFVGFWVMAIWRLPSLELRVDGIWHHDLFGTAAIPWLALQPARPVQSATGHRLVLAINRPEMVRTRGLKRKPSRIPVNLLDVHPRFLADAIRFYVTFPEHRPAIGTDPEHDRLRDMLLKGHAPPQHQQRQPPSPQPRST